MKNSVNGWSFFSKMKVKAILFGRVQRTKKAEVINNFRFLTGERAGIRTRDPLIKSQMLYRLSYAPSLLGKCIIYKKHIVNKKIKKKEKNKNV